MKTVTSYIACIAAGCLLSVSGCDTRDNSPTTTTTSTPARSTTSAPATTAPADTTDRDWYDVQTDRDRESDRDAKTPMDQSQSSEHISQTADIRRAVMADETLSMGAKNCKIITDQSGRVWLRGVVSSQAEKNQIESIARRIAGANNVTNELEVNVS
jgi:hyperosmotically inducible protein